MIRRRPGSAPSGTEPDETEGLLRRWVRRKQEVRREQEADAGRSSTAGRDADPGSATEPPPLPDLESLGAEGDYSGFLHPEVSAALRRAALRKLFHSAKFNVVDGLDDYAEDYRSFEALGDVVTADLRHQLERAAARREVGDEAPGTAEAPTAADSAPAPAASPTTTNSESADGLDHPAAERG